MPTRPSPFRSPLAVADSPAPRGRGPGASASVGEERPHPRACVRALSVGSGATAPFPPGTQTREPALKARTSWRRQSWLLARVVAASLLLGCPHKEPEGESCTPVEAGEWGGGIAFVEGTDDWGLADVRGVHYAAGDLDGDGYPDLIVTEGTTNTRDSYPDTRIRYVMMNRADGDRRTFVDETESSGLLAARDGNTTGTSHNFYIEGDVDGDGDLDLFAGRYYDTGTDDATGDCSEIYLNNGVGHFTLAATSDVCIAEGYPTSAAAFTDFDADGVLDLWVTGWYVAYGTSYEAGQAQLYRGNGDGTFTVVTEDVGLKLKKGLSTSDYLERDVRRPSYGATACDVNGDMLPDLISSNYGRAWNHLWRNDGGTFVETGEEAHFDADTNLDYSDNLMYVCYCETNACSVEPSESCGGSFPDYYWTVGYDDQPARLGGNSFTTVCADIDNDGDNDLYTAEIAHMWAGESADRTELLLNDGTGIFERMNNDDNGLARKRSQMGDWNEGDLFAGFLDFDNDGWRDILLVTSDYEDTHLWFWRQTSAGQFEEVSDETGMNQEWPSGLAIADFDLDGDLDVVTGSSTARTGTPWTEHNTHLYENQQGGNYVRFVGLPIGSRVEIEAGGQYQMAEVNGGYGTFGIVSDTVAQFGLADVCMVDTVTVTLPGGEAHSFENKAGNQAVQLTW